MNRFLMTILLGVWAAGGMAFSQEFYLKLYLSEEGIYKVSGEELADAGIILSTIQPQTLQLFSDGQRILPYEITAPEPQLQEVAIEVNDGGDGQFDPQDYILFYGQAVNRFEWDDTQIDYRYITDPYDTLSCYWLRWNVAPGKRIPTKDGSPVTGNAIRRDQFIDYLHLEKDRFNPFRSGLTWTWNLFGQVNTFDKQFELSGVMSSTAEVTTELIYYNFFEYSNAPGEIMVTVNGMTVGPQSFDTWKLDISDIFPIQEGSNDITWQYLPSSGEDTLAQRGVNWLELRYQRSTTLLQNNLKITLGESSGIFHTRYRAAGDPDPIRIFDVTDPFNLQEIFTTNDTLFEDTLSGEHKVYWLQRSGHEQMVARIQPAQRGLFSNSDGAQYLIITDPLMQEALLPLKAHREVFNGFSVKIVSTDDMMNEFAFGRQDPTAIRNFIRFAYNNWNPQPQFVLLAGNGYYDYRNITGEFPHNWILPFEIDASDNVFSRATDDYFVDLDFSLSRKVNPPFPQEDILLALPFHVEDPGSSPSASPSSPGFSQIVPDIAIGRLPADSPEDVASIVAKILGEETRIVPGLWRISALFIADDQFTPAGGGEFFHLTQAENISRNLPASVRRLKLYEVEYPFAGDEKPSATRQLINRINAGNRFLVYVGHASEVRWTHENLLNFQRDIRSIRNHDKIGFSIGISTPYRGDDGKTGIIGTLLKRSHRGLLASVAPNRPVFAYQNEQLVQAFWQNLYSQAGGFVGEGLRLAKASGNTNDQKFFLLGDPAINITLPDETVQINTVNPQPFPARGTVEIAGQVSNGTSGDSLLIEVREPGKMRLSGTTIYESTGGVLYRGFVPLDAGGNFSLQFVVSSDVPHDSVLYRGRLFAYIWNSSREGMGFLDSIAVGGVDSSGTDNTPPQLNLSITAGDSGEQSPILIADLSDVNGINLSTWQNHDPMVFIDGNMQDTLHVGDFFSYASGSSQSGTLRYPLPYLSSGGHTLTLNVHDTYNNPASETVSFVVNIKTPPAQMPDRITLLQNYPNPFNPETTIPFVLSGNRRFRVRVEIYNILGQRVRSLLNTVLPGGEHSVRWDGRNDGGNPVASGVYIYRLRVSTAGVKGNGAARGGVYQHSRKMVLLR